MRIIKKIENLKPGQVVTKIMGAKIVIEAKEGVFKDLKKGYKLNI